MLRVDPVADREKGLRSAARDAETGAWLIRGIRTEAEKSLVTYVEKHRTCHTFTSARRCRAQVGCYSR